MTKLTWLLHGGVRMAGTAEKSATQSFYTAIQSFYTAKISAHRDCILGLFCQNIVSFIGLFCKRVSTQNLYTVCTSYTVISHSKFFFPDTNTPLSAVPATHTPCRIVSYTVILPSEFWFVCVAGGYAWLALQNRNFKSQLYSHFTQQFFLTSHEYTLCLQCQPRTHPAAKSATQSSYIVNFCLCVWLGGVRGWHCRIIFSKVSYTVILHGRFSSMPTVAKETYHLIGMKFSKVSYTDILHRRFSSMLTFVYVVLA